MFRRFHPILSAFALLLAPIAMQSGVAMAAMPMDHGDMAKGGHCGETAPEEGDKPGSTTPCCIAMCAAVAPPDAAMIEPFAYHAPLLASWAATDHRPFLAELPTPPPRLA